MKKEPNPRLKLNRETLRRVSGGDPIEYEVMSAGPECVHMTTPQAGCAPGTQSCQGC